MERADRVGVNNGTAVASVEKYGNMVALVPNDEKKKDYMPGLQKRSEVGQQPVQAVLFRAVQVARSRQVGLRGVPDRGREKGYPGEHRGRKKLKGEVANFVKIYYNRTNLK